MIQELTNEQIRRELLGDKESLDFSEFISKCREVLELIKKSDSEQKEVNYLHFFNILKRQNLFLNNLTTDMYSDAYQFLVWTVFLLNNNFNPDSWGELLTRLSVIKPRSTFDKLLYKGREVDQVLNHIIDEWWEAEVNRPTIHMTNGEVTHLEQSVVNKKLNGEDSSFSSVHAITNKSREILAKHDQLDFMIATVFQKLTAYTSDRKHVEDEVEMGEVDVPLPKKDKYSMVVQFGYFQKKIFIDGDSLKDFTSFREQFLVATNLDKISQRLRSEQVFTSEKQINLARKAVNELRERVDYYSIHPEKINDENRDNVEEDKEKLFFLMNKLNNLDLYSLESVVSKFGFSKFQHDDERVKIAFSGEEKIQDVQSSIDDPQDMSACDLRVSIASWEEVGQIDKFQKNELFFTNGVRSFESLVFGIYQGQVVLVGVKAPHAFIDGAPQVQETNKCIERAVRLVNNSVLPNKNKGIYQVPKTPDTLILDEQIVYAGTIDESKLRIRERIGKGNGDNKIFDFYLRKYGIKIPITSLLSLVAMMVTKENHAQYLEIYKKKKLVPTTFVLPEEVQQEIVAHESGSKVNRKVLTLLLAAIGANGMLRQVAKNAPVSDSVAFAILAGKLRIPLTQLSKRLSPEITELLQDVMLVSTLVQTSQTQIEALESGYSYQRAFTTASGDGHINKCAMAFCDAREDKIQVSFSATKESSKKYEHLRENFNDQVEFTIQKILTYLEDGMGLVA